MQLEKAIQDYYPIETAVCYGCGRNNPDGLHIKSYWDGEQGVCHYTPKPYHLAFPGYVYGGLIASVIDCHSIGTAIAAMYQAANIHPAEDHSITCVTGNMNITFLKPTPTETELVLRATVKELHDRKAIVTCSLYADDLECVQGELVAVRVKSRANVQGHHQT